MTSHCLDVLDPEMRRNKPFADYIRDTLAAIELYADHPGPEGKIVSDYLVARLFRRSNNLDNSKFDGQLYRGDNDFQSRANGQGQRKAYLDAEGNLVSPNPRGNKDIEDCIVDHVNAKSAQDGKSNSPLTSTSSFPGETKASSLLPLR